MKENIYENLINLLKKNKNYVDDNGKIIKTKIYQDTMAMNKELISLLLNNEEIKKKFFVKVDDTYIFDKQGFSWFIEEKEFLPDSYTRYTNKIGLFNNDGFISQNNNVVLNFPYKDCILEGGQTKEEQKRNEIFYNEIIANDEITKMLEPKVFSNIKRYTSKGIEDNDILFNNSDNMIIKGNNLIGLYSILKKYEGKIKLIYIDPPYNTGSDSFSYNDKFNRSSWLVFMKNRLEVAKKLLSPDGAIYVQLDYHQVHYAKVLMDEIFGEDNFQREIIWRIGWLSGYKTTDRNWIRNHDTILFYSKNKELMKQKFNKKYIKNEDFKDIIDESSLSKELVNYNLNKDEIKQVCNFINHKNRPDKYPIEDIWNGNEYDDLNSIAITSFSGETVSKMLNSTDEVKGQKSEKLLARIIEAHTEPGDIVLDFFGGTGTTGAVAQKMNRRYILIEQLDKHIDIMVRRLSKVLQGEQSGVSKKYNWNGGGSFVYCELKEDGQRIIDKIVNCDNEEKLKQIKEKIYNDNRIVPYITKEELEIADNDFENLELVDQKQILVNLIDKNKLYVNYTDIDDIEYHIENNEKNFCKSFYDKEN